MDDRLRTSSGSESKVHSPQSIVRLLELGVVDYLQALEMQRELVRRRQADETPDTLLLLEHPPVITLGRNADRKNLLVSDAELAWRGVELVKVERGGDITFHGPGQLIGYPVFRLRNRDWGIGNGEEPKDGRGQKADGRRQNAEAAGQDGAGLVGVKRFVESVEQALVNALAELGVKAEKREKQVGVWVRDAGDRTKLEVRMQNAECRIQDMNRHAPVAPEHRLLEPLTPGTVSYRKIASIGVAVSRHVTFHGFALNISTDLSWFGLMNPCGFPAAQMTSVERESGKADMAAARRAVVRGFESAFGRALSPES